MAGIIAFLPGFEGQDRSELERRGLASLLDRSVDPIFTPVRKGPGDHSGTLVAFMGQTLDIVKEYDEHAQEWLEAPPDGELARGRYWIGYVKARKPSAGDLQRAKLIPGEPVCLDDGQAWIVPCSHYAPRHRTRDRETGQETFIVKDEHREWVEWSNELFDQILSEGFPPLSGGEYSIHVPYGLKYASLTLSKNYRVNMDVLDLLKVIPEDMTQLVLAAIGVTRIAELAAQKKSTELFSLFQRWNSTRCSTAEGFTLPAISQPLST
jgi:hypothetical protein